MRTEALTAGTFSVMLNVCAFDRPFWGSETVMLAVPSAASKAAGILAWSCPVLTKLVASG